MSKYASIAVSSLVLVGSPAACWAQDTFLVGVTAAMTGPIAAGYAPVADGMRIYVDKLNAAGGINGKKIRLIIRDDQSDATKGAANVKRLIEEDKVNLLVNDSASTTYQPTMAEVRRSETPVLFVGVCPTEVYPPAKPLMFCTNSFASHYDSRAALDFIKDSAGTVDLNLGLLAQTLPIARAEIDYAEVLAKEMKMKPVDKEIIPVTTSDFTPFATKVNSANPQWIWAWIAWDLQTGSLQSLRRLGWTGKFVGWSHIQAEDDLPRVKDQNFYTIGTNSLFFQGLPVQKEIVAAAKADGISYSPTRLTEGWIAGMTIEATLKAASAKGAVTRASIASAMETLTIDTHGLRGTPITWTKDNHFRTVQSYRAYRWNGTALEAMGDWRKYDVKP
jgi:ABC-type branched-subunit amino acid transport system substrate-binding protein